MKFNHTLPMKMRFALPPLMIAAVAAGCGGGGGGGPTVPTPTPTPIGSGSCSATSFTPNYVPSIILLRWASFPLRVYFVADANYTQARQTLALNGLNEWVQATGGKVNYFVTSDPSSADITVAFYNFSGGSGDELGSTSITYTTDDNVLQRADTTIGITGTQGDDLNTAAHEFGHALGIDGHSPATADLMNAFGNFPNGCNCITASDLNTLLTSYCGRFGTARRAPSTGPTRTVVIH